MTTSDTRDSASTLVGIPRSRLGLNIVGAGSGRMKILLADWNFYYWTTYK